MKPMTRRVFGERMLPTSFAVAWKISRPDGFQQDSTAHTSAGGTLSDEEGRLVERFLLEHKKNVSMVMSVEITNSVPPAFVVQSPDMQVRND